MLAWRGARVAQAPSRTGRQDIFSGRSRAYTYFKTLPVCVPRHQTNRPAGMCARQQTGKRAFDVGLRARAIFFQRFELAS